MNGKTRMIMAAAAAMMWLAGCDENNLNAANQQFFAPHQQYGGAQNYPGQPGGAASGQQSGSSGAMSGSAGNNSMYTPPPLYGQAQPGPQQQPMTPDAPRPLADSGIRADSELGGSSAVAYAGKLKDKCIELQNELIKAQKDKQAMEDKIRALELENVALRNDKAQAEKELKEANEAAMGIKRELEAWKKDVITYRGQIADALAQNLSASYLIIKLLGGDESRLQPKPSQSVQPTNQAAPAADNTAAKSVGGE